MRPHLMTPKRVPRTAQVVWGLEVVLAAPMVRWSALDYYRRGWLGIVNRAPDRYTLIGLRVIVALVCNVFARAKPNALSAHK